MEETKKVKKVLGSEALGILLGRVSATAYPQSLSGQRASAPGLRPP